MARPPSFEENSVVAKFTLGLFHQTLKKKRGNLANVPLKALSWTRGAVTADLLATPIGLMALAGCIFQMLHQGLHQVHLA